MQGKNVLLTAGPTREPIDPVRFISNYSSGKMGIAIAEEAAKRGANVTLVKGSTTVQTSNPEIKIVNVQTAAEMYEVVSQHFEKNDVVIFAAAVADYTPKNPAATKIKKKEAEFVLELVKTKDIALEMGKRKTDAQICVGFALETDNEAEHAKGKLQSKNLDIIVLNSLRDEGAGFQLDTNKITIMDKRKNQIAYDTKSKSETAVDILNYIEDFSRK
ncbi:MAG TPA: phosphopantothenoylcysteine decarboxylase [Chitinophagales bacterium]